MVRGVVLRFPTAADTGPKLRPASPTGEAIPQPSVGDRGSLHSHGPGASGHPGSGKRRRPREDSSGSKSRIEPELRGGKGGPRRPAAFSRTKRCGAPFRGPRADGGQLELGIVLP